jgi:hypothetical protein
MSERTYNFGTRPNSYFRGADVRVERDDGSAIAVNRKDGLWAVNVKDDNLLRDIPGDVRALADELGEAMAQRLYEMAQTDFWHWATTTLAPEHGFETVFSEGRSGGWLSVAGTRDWDAEMLFRPAADEREARDRFLALAFQAVEAVDGFRDIWYDQIREQHAEMMRKPESFTLVAFPLFPDGSTGDALAEHHGETVHSVFDGMASAIARWMPPQDHKDGDEEESATPDAIDLTLSWTLRTEAKND